MATTLGNIVDAMQAMHAAVDGVTKAPLQAAYPLVISRKQLPFVWTYITDVDPYMDNHFLCDVSMTVICLCFPLNETASFKKRLGTSDSILGRLVKLWNDDNTKANSTIKSWRSIKGVGGHMHNWHGKWYYAVGVELVARVYL